MRNHIAYLFCTISLIFTIHISAQSSKSLENIVSDNNESAELLLQEGKLAEAAQIYNQTAFLLLSNSKATDAADYYQKVVDLNRRLGNKEGEIKAIGNIAMSYLLANQYEKAIPNLEEELSYYRLKKRKKNMLGVLVNLAETKNETGRLNEAVQNLNEAISLALELENHKILKTCYTTGYAIYQNLGNSDKAQEYYQLAAQIDKKLTRDEAEIKVSQAKEQVDKAYTEKRMTEEELIEKEEKLEKTVTTLEKAERLTKEQYDEILEKEEYIKTQDVRIREEQMKRKYLTIGLAILTVFVMFMLIMILLIRKANRKINQQRLRLQKQNKEIRASIRYAKTIQQAVLPDINQIEKVFDPFIIYRPKDIVSGDFYWYSKRTHKSTEELYFAAVDCTGHGVPGAFMSMIGAQLLNELVNELHLREPSEILAELNHRIRISLRQEQTDNNDGMDLALCRFTKNGNSSYKLCFAGAKRNIYISKNSDTDLICLSGDRKSIGGYNLSRREVKFNDKEIAINKGDIVYLFTDGIIDQNGPDRRKFGRIRLEEILSENAKLSPAAQKGIIEEKLNDFIQNEEQRDDITLVGLKIM